MFSLSAITYFCHLNLLMPEQNNQPQSQINIEISEEVAEGQYANLAIITHSHAEFVIDFVNVMPGTPKSKVKSRIIFTPHIKDLEEVQIPLTFGGPAGQA
jgi:hypothetical protein